MDKQTNEHASDVKKKHAQRCARGLHTRRKSRPTATTLDGQSQPHETEQEHDIAPHVATCTAIQEDLPHIPFSPTLDDDMTIGALDGSLTLHSQPENDFVLANAADSQLTIDNAPHGSSPSTAFTFRNMPPRMVSSHVTSYFMHFHAFFPILHRPTFKLASCPDQLASIVVALGSKYSSSPITVEGQIETSEGLWQSGVESLQSLVCRMSFRCFPLCMADRSIPSNRFALSPA